ncbi:MAG: ATP-binding protein [Defluviitaleaceae bacterium]|nr:ATP-binding protein [Defluviitaleaceae bacterium]
MTDLLKSLIVLFVVLAALNMFFAWQSPQALERMRDAQEEKHELIVATYDYRISSMLLTRYARLHAAHAYTQSGDVDESYSLYRMSYKNHLASTESILEVFARRGVSFNEIQQVRNAIALSNELRQIEQDAIFAVDSGNVGHAMCMLYGGNISQNLNSLSDILESLDASIMARVSTRVEEENAASQLYSNSIIIMSIILAGASVGGTIILLREVKRAMYQVSETAKINKQEEELREIAEEENLAKTRFLAQMSHEIRTPMNAVLGIAEIELIKANHSRETQEAFLRIHSSSKLLLTLINDILDLSKVEAGKMEIVNVEYETTRSIVDTVMLNIAHIGSKNIIFNLDVNENLPVKLIGDEPRIRQILNNFLSNAFKYTEEGEVTLAVGKVGVSGKSDEIQIVFTVTDTGQGMTHEQIETLFEAEYTRFNIQANRAIEGTGLGMSIVKRILDMMNGTVDIQSVPGEGSTFIIKIPQKVSGKEVLGKETVAKLRAMKLTTDGASVSQATEPMPYGNVLAVDDIESNLYVIEGYLTPYQLQVETVSSGQAAIDKVNAGNVYDIIFMDHMMPDMDGLETTKILRENGYTAPIIALTANTIKGAQELFMKNGFSGFIAKPINILQLHASLLKYIRDKQPPDVILAAHTQAAQIETMKAEAGAPSVSEKVVASFLRDAKRALEIMQDAMARTSLDADTIRAYAIQAHGMKSALANVEKIELSDQAKDLETAANANDFQVIYAKTPSFIEGVKLIMAEFAPPEEAGDASDSDPEFLAEQLKIIADACENYDKKTAAAALKSLKEKVWSSETNALITEIDTKILHAEFEEVVEIIASSA